MFTVKATFGHETRRFTFQDAVLFPAYAELRSQLCRLFPISPDYCLSCLIFSPDASKPGRILVGKEVHSAEDYDSCIAPLRRRWPNPLLRFTVFDEQTPYKAHSVAPDSLSLHSVPTIPLSETSKSPSPVGSRHGCTLPLNSQSLTSPPSPALQTSTTRIAPLETSPPLPPTSLSPTPNVSCSHHIAGKAGTTPCCPINKAKADIDILLSSFKDDVERILSSAFGSSYAEQPALLVKDFTSPVSDVGAVAPQPDTSATASAYAARWCFVCRTSFTGVWYGCVKCPWHAICPSCFSKSHGAHTLSFGPSHVVQQRSTDSFARVSAQVADDVKPHGVVSTTSPLPESTSTSPAADHEPARTVLHDVICDGCHKTVVGVRHKCLDCPDYDLCTVCMESGAAERHNPFHEFFDIELYVHTVLGHDRDTSRGDCHRVSVSDHAQVTQQGLAAIAIDSAVRHAAACNLCDSPIVGERYKCLICPDFDTCSSCFRITTEQHPGHGFVKVNKPEDLVMRDSLPLRQVAHQADCDSCYKTICGARYKCMHSACPDFDLCSDCEALPIPVHPVNHPLLKLKTSGTVIPAVYRVGRTQAADGIRSQDPIPVRSESTNSPSPSSPVAPMNPPQTIPVSNSGLVTNTAMEDHAPTGKEFLSPFDSPMREAPTPVADTPSHQVDVVELTDSPRCIRLPLEIYHQPRPEVNQEILFMNAVKVADSISNPISSTSSEPVVVESPVELLLHVTPGTTSQADGHHWISPASPVSVIKPFVDDYHTPSPMSSNGRKLQHVMPQSAADDQQEIALRSPLNSALLSDINIPDGQIFPPGAEFVKGWHMVNNGTLPWPATTEVRFVAGEMFAPKCCGAKAKVGVVHPGQDLDIWTGDLKAPDVPGRYVGYWRLNDGQGNYFGGSVWIDLIVVDHHSDQASEHPLAASSMVMPSAHPTNSVSVSDAPQDALRRSLPSTGTAVDGDEDPESDISSLFLVSASTSDDDDAEWQDTRTHSERLEYVVLYDSHSEE